ncbi:MAG: sulfatase-like hydrolase/transferase [Candidatus Omnitrophica bacterium]|nr:sulfatase-like hydrolase/transferase [Candidatus Omnitrophota bacterium]
MKPPQIFHPYLFAAFPIWFLFLFNIEQIRPRETLVPLGASLACTGVLWYLLTRLLKDKAKAAAVTSLIVLVFFSYGELIHALEQWEGGRSLFPRQRYAALALALPFLCGAIFLIRRRGHFQTATRALNTASCGLFLAALVTITHSPEPQWREAPEEEGLSAGNPIEPLPDIYYIILDGYGRHDVLKEIYGYDNSEFLSWLTQKGFFIAEKSRSNYHATNFSLASSLNFFYPHLDAGFKMDHHCREPYFCAIQTNRAASLLKQHGYEVVSASFIGMTADRELTAPWTLSRFQGLVFRATPIPAVLYQLGSPFAYENHRRRLGYLLDQLPRIARVTGRPIFVYAHILMPHPPFVFKEDGQLCQPSRDFSTADGNNFYKDGGTREEYLNGYRGQIAFLTRRVKGMIEEILSDKERPALVVLQGDHGPGSGLTYGSVQRTDLWERMSILNAYRLPNGGGKELYPEITPVNTFRVVFNHVLGTRLPLLADRSYFRERDGAKTWLVEVTGQIHER